jgi:uncharacterized membrane protein
LNPRRSGYEQGTGSNPLEEETKVPEQRPVDVPREPRPAAFDNFAERISRFASNGRFFAICLAAVIIWIPTIAIFHSADAWQLVINTLTSVLAFLLIALLQNSERRYDDALHAKLNAVAAGVADLMEQSEARGDRQLRDHLDDLRAAVGVERDI